MDQSTSNGSALSETWQKLAVGAGAVGILSGLLLPIVTIPLAGGVTLLDAAEFAEFVGESATELYLVLVGIVVGSLLLIAGGLKQYTVAVAGGVIQSATVAAVLYYLVSEGVFSAEVMGQSVVSPGIGLYGVVGAAILGIVSILLGR